MLAKGQALLKRMYLSFLRMYPCYPYLRRLRHGEVWQLADSPIANQQHVQDLDPGGLAPHLSSTMPKALPALLTRVDGREAQVSSGEYTALGTGQGCTFTRHYSFQ